MNPLHEEIKLLKGIIAQHDLCHDMHGKVGCEDFAAGCVTQIKGLYGRCPWEEEIERLKNDLYHLARLSLSDKRDDVVMYTRRLCHRYRIVDAALSDKLFGLLGPSDKGNILRGEGRDAT